MKNTTIAIDLAKSVFEIGISDRPGHVAKNHRLSRNEVAAFVAAQPPATIIMEACSSAHFWGRKFQGFGHDVKLLPPFAVRPYVQRSKTDRLNERNIFPAAARLRFELMDEPVRPARGKADNTRGHFWPVQRLAPRARISSWPGALRSIKEAGDTTAV